VPPALLYLRKRAQESSDEHVHPLLKSCDVTPFLSDTQHFTFEIETERRKEREKDRKRERKRDRETRFPIGFCNKKKELALCLLHMILPVMGG
jgi:hypothetical protein